MIQRVQTIYLFLAAILSLLAIALSIPYVLSGSTPLELNDCLPVLILCSLTTATSLAAIFLFRNRILQINVSRLALLLTIAAIIVATYCALTTEGSDVPQPGMAFPLLNVILNVLAIRGIRADERLVRSMDRLR